MNSTTGGAYGGRRTAGAVLLTVGAFWAARHLMHGSFGFYEDDYTLVVRSMDASWGEVLEYLRGLLQGSAGQGRPLQPAMVSLLSYATGQLGGLRTAYWVAFGIVAANCTLFYFVARRLFPPSFALMGGLSYALFAADTTQAFLYHAFGLQQSLSYFLLATLLYLSRRHTASYLLIVGSLLSYEPVYPLFLAVPLLEDRWDRMWRRRLLRHALILAALMALLVAFRLWLGEGRVSGVTAREILTVPLSHMLIGPVVAMGSYLLRPIQALQQLTLATAAVCLAAFALICWKTRRVELPEPHGKRFFNPLRVGIRNALADRLSQGNPDTGTENQAIRVVRLFLGALAILVLAYPLTFTVRPYAISGRDTRVHMAAAPGAALLFTTSWYFGLASVGRLWSRRAARAVLAADLSLMLGFGLVLQADYSEAWNLQRRLWTGIIDHLPKLQEGVVILIDPAGLVDTRYIGANTWNLPFVMQYVFEFPSYWSEPPRVHRLLPDWRQRSLANSVEIKAVDYSWQYVVVPWERVVILETRDGGISGSLSSAQVREVTYSIGIPNLAAVPLPPKGFLHSQLVEGQR